MYAATCSRCYRIQCLCNGLCAGLQQMQPQRKSHSGTMLARAKFALQRESLNNLRPSARRRQDLALGTVIQENGYCYHRRVSCNSSRCLASCHANCVLDNIAKDNVEITKPREVSQIDKKFIIKNIFILLEIISATKI